MALADIDQMGVALADVTAAYGAFRPPRRVSVSEGAGKILYFKQPGGVPGLWDSTETPYMVEPMDMLASRRHEAVVFVGPARTGKTAGLLLGWMSHVVVNDPGDMLFIQMTQDKAREFSKTDIDRALTSPKLDELLSRSRHDDNTHDKKFRHGMWMRIAWPTSSNVSGSTYRYVAITDLDRMANAENVDGEGPLFDLARKRTTTFMSRGMCLVESSPGIEIEDPNWRAVTPHEGPPVTGVVGIYNRSDRRRWYWRCPMCDDWFEPKPGIELFGLPSDDILLEIVREANLEAMATEHNRIVCPHCQGRIGPRAKRDLNLGGRWVQDGLILTRKNELVGQAHESTIAGYWMGGIPAAYQSWRSIVLRYLQGLRDYAMSGSEESLKTTTNTDQGLPYMSRLLLDAKKQSTDPAERKEQGMLRYVVPDETRFIISTVDVQGGMGARFIVQVHAVGPNLEQWLVDRYAITESMREGMGTEFAPIDPAAHAEDWDVLTERVVRASYRTKTDGVEMRVKLTVVDTGGEDGVTERAYAWFRRVRRAGMAQRVMLVKGVGRDAKSTTPMIRETMQGGLKPGAKGDIPVYLIHTNMLKDAVWSGLKRQVPGPNYYHFPAWLPAAFFDELQSEVRLPNGTWQQIRKRNEALDLCVYARAGCLRLGADKINWARPPVWAREIENNSERITREERRELQENAPVAPVPLTPAEEKKVAPRGRRAGRSNYIG